MSAKPQSSAGRGRPENAAEEVREGMRQPGLQRGYLHRAPTPVGQGRRPLLDVTLAIRKSPRSARLSTFSLGLHYNHIIEAI